MLRYNDMPEILDIMKAGKAWKHFRYTLKGLAEEKIGLDSEVENLKKKLRGKKESRTSNCQESCSRCYNLRFVNLSHSQVTKKIFKWFAKLTAVPLGPGSNPGDDMNVCKCIVPSRHGGTLNSHRAASPLVRLVEEEERWEAPDHPQGVLPQNSGETELNRSVTCMTLKATITTGVTYSFALMNFVGLVIWPLPISPSDDGSKNNERKREETRAWTGNVFFYDGDDEWGSGGFSLYKGDSVRFFPFFFYYYLSCRFTFRFSDFYRLRICSNYMSLAMPTKPVHQLNFECIDI
ncbi:uncharacterized protein TNCV_4663451 [Trichonephila clavipes]|uniref:Uncharacterized protein n=1 Tax=Trichonephila clavipes TaxID=2585209 RepID=A0A8X6VE05_TRICX|nr:uncharacterized protein TNCV_4663451 [Trichonephila clavipes]